MPSYEFHTVDVFTGERFGGNPLAIFPDACGMSSATMQALAAEMNYSETTFVLPPRDAANTAQVRIFNRTSEMPFAGHPNVGTGYMLAKLGLASGPVLRFEEVSGVVEVRLDSNGLTEIDAPQPLQIFEEFSDEAISRCLSLKAHQIVTANHSALRASVGVDFVLVEVAAGALAAAAPNLAAYRQVADTAPALGGRLSIFLYEGHGSDVQARMFAPLAGTWEDAATGSANAALAALRLSLISDQELVYKSSQGLEMGRPSELFVRSWRAKDGFRASVAGRCVPVFSGTVQL